MRLTEQVDRTGDRLTYSWLLDAPYRHRKHFPLWKWFSGRGCKGCFVTNDAAAARYVADGFDLNVESTESAYSQSGIAVEEMRYDDDEEEEGGKVAAEGGRNVVILRS